MKLTIIDLDFHRNGIQGAPFYVALFYDGHTKKLAVVFQEKGYCAVLDVRKLAGGDIAFGSNSWRGDVFEPELRKAIDEYNRNN